jgi:RimJ/RimL family protein N-acetyltransferase
VDEIINDLGQPIGPALPDWKIPAWPPREQAAGRFCRLEPLDMSRHAAALYAELAVEVEGRTWTYLPYGPFKGFDEFRDWLGSYCLGKDPRFYAILEQSAESPLGLAAYLRINPAEGVIEVGHLIFSPRLRRTPVATEAMYLMMQRAFEMGYRRYEWKCDSLNAKSRAAAERLGFQFEGIFRQDRVYKERSRDTAWFSIIDSEWPLLKERFERWLAPENFDANGRQRKALRAAT